jgi:ParB family chromosome partitioning protein
VPDLIKIPVDQLDPDPANPRKPDTLEEKIELLESIRQFGLLTPLRAWKKPDGRYQLIAGHRRVDALKLGGIPEADCVVEERPESATAFLTDALNDNNCRKNFGPMDLLTLFLGVIADNPGISNVGVAEKTGYPEKKISTVLSLKCLTPELQARLRAGGLPERAAVAIARLKPERQLEPADAVTAGRMTAVECEQFVKKALKAGSGGRPAKKIRMKVELDPAESKAAVENWVAAVVAAHRSWSRSGTGPETFPAHLKQAEKKAS